MTEEEKRTHKLETLRQRRIDDYQSELLGYQLRGPAFHVLLVPPKSLDQDLNVNLSVVYQDDMAPTNGHRGRADMQLETSLNYDGQLALETLTEGGGVVYAVQFFHSGAIEIVIPIERANDGKVVTSFWNDALNLAARASTSIESISGETRFYFVATLVGTHDFRSQVDDKRHVCERPYYRFPVVEVADHRALHSDPVRAVGIRIAHTLGRKHL